LSGLSPALASCLKTTDEAAIEAIASTPALAAEARQQIVRVGMLVRKPATREEILQIVGSRFSTFPQPQRGEAEWAAWWSDYFQTLSDVSAESLELGMRAAIARADTEFLPKPGQLRALAIRQLTPGARAVNLMRRGIEAAEERERAAYRGDFRLEAPQMRRVKTPEDRETVRQMRDELVRGHATRNAERAAAPPMAGLFPPRPTDRGLTAEMRDLLEAQHGTRYPYRAAADCADVPDAL
jgi:hypothetical protein